nr:hypothetical protein [Enterococcus gallinarum]
MNYQKMQNNYLKNQVMSASPNKLIEMLFAGSNQEYQIGSVSD